METFRNISTIWPSRRPRALAGILAAALLASCSSNGGDWQMVSDLAKQYWSGDKRDVTLKEASSVPFASMGVRLGDGPQAIIVVVGGTHEPLLWTSAARIALTTLNGRIIRTAGFGHDLGGYVTQDNSGDWAVARTYLWQADYPDMDLYGVTIQCQERPAGAETIQILGADIHTNRVDESCRSVSAKLSWSFENSYWIDPNSALVWRSIQNVSPKLAPIETEILRPPA